MFGDLPEPFRYTEKEAALVAKLAEVRVAADGGNRKAKKKIAKMRKQLAVFKKRAKRGNPIAARAVQVIEESGLLEPSQTFEMEGAGEATPDQLLQYALDLRQRAAGLSPEHDAARRGYLQQAESLEAQARLRRGRIQAAQSAISPYNPWGWRIGNLRPFPAALLLTSGVLAYMRKWGWAAVPAGIVAIHEAKQKGWF